MIALMTKKDMQKRDDEQQVMKREIHALCGNVIRLETEVQRLQEATRDFGRRI